MNRRLLDPFQSVQLPDKVEEVLDHGVARSIAFNNAGTILAAGCQDGRIVLYDFQTRGVASVLQGHKDAVTGVEWSRDGRMLVSGSLDGRVIRWDVEHGTPEADIMLPAMVSAISVDEYAQHLCVASHMSGPPDVIDLRDGSVRTLPSVATDADSKGSSAAATAVATRSGEQIFLGQARGVILVVDTMTLQISDAVKVPGAPRILGMTLNRQGSLLLVLGGDRIIRLYEVARPQQRGHVVLRSVDDVRRALASSRGSKGGSLLAEGGPLHTPGASPALELQREFSNAVERTSWRAAAFTFDSEHVVGAAGAASGAANSSAGHQLYVWSAFTGRLEKVLDARASPAALALAAHPRQHILAAACHSGQIFIWSKEYQENWSAFAPDFKELKANEEYVEREDEFDVNERPATPKADEGADASDVDVDIMALDPELRGFSSDEEAPGRPRPLTHIPVVIPQQEDLRQAAEAAATAAEAAAAAEPAAQDAEHAPTPSGSGEGMQAEKPGGTSANGPSTASVPGGGMPTNDATGELQRPGSEQPAVDDTDSGGSTKRMRTS